jgi:hypothetical protein
MPDETLGEFRYPGLTGLMFRPRTRNSLAWPHRRAVILLSAKDSRCGGRHGQGMPNQTMHAEWPVASESKG